MAQLVVEGDEVVVRLSPAEKFWGFHGNMRVPLAAVRNVSVPEYPYAELRGWRMAGTGLPGLIALGTRRHATGYDFTAVRRQRPSVQVDLNGPPRWQRLLLPGAPSGDAEPEADKIPAAAGIARR